jgi:hypothetical protein
VVAALVGAGFELAGEYPHSLTLRHPSGERVQAVVDPGFDDMIQRAETVEVGGVTIRAV